MTPPPHEIPSILVGKQLVVVDVEGNGQQPPEIIELAALAVDQGAQATDVRSWLIHPQKPITPIVTRKVHGISNADVADSPSWADVAENIATMLGNRTLVAHNATVEHAVLQAHLPGWAPPMVLDTLRLARHVWPDIPGYGLDKLIAHANLDTTAFADAGYHRAGYDTWCAWRLLCRLIQDGDLDWAGLVKAAAVPGFAATDDSQGGLW